MPRISVPTAALPREGLCLHLGCGQHAMGGWVNCDLRKHSPHVDEAFDLMADWPFPDQSVRAIYASHVLEHLPSPQQFFREAWRVCKPYATVDLRVPYGGAIEAWHDLTHLRPWYPACFAFLQPGYDAAVGNPQYETWASPFAVDLIQVRLHPRLLWLWRRRWVRKRLHAWQHFFPTTGLELYATLLALKTPAAQEAYAATARPNVVPQTFCVFQHEWERRPLRAGETYTLHTLA